MKIHKGKEEKRKGEKCQWREDIEKRLGKKITETETNPYISITRGLGRKDDLP